nr:hypothetical protein [Tanacetum cinerariifolium]
MMSLATLPLSFWDYALESAVCILNMVPTKKVDKTPYKLWHGKVSNLSYLKVWGCEAHVKRHTPDKLQQKSVKCILVGYPKETMGYYFYYPPENKIVVDRSVRTHKAFDRLCLNVEIDPDRLCFNVEVEEYSLGDLKEPANYKAALSDPEFEKWLVAMNAEMQSMYDNKAWRLVVLPPNAKVVKNIRAIWILIAIAAYYDYKIWQMDVKTVFLNGFLQEEIYMEQPKGFIDPNHPRKVCKLQRSIYGLKQASRSWNKRFDEKIKKFGFHQNLDESCVYQKASRSNVIFLILYVDDIILMENHIPSLQEVKTYLGKCFSMKDLEEAVFILEIKIYRDRSKRLIGLSQNAYLDKILKRYRMDNSKRGSIPMQVDLHLSKSQCATTFADMKRMQNVSYALAVGSIMYVVSCTKPDVAFAQNITIRFQQNSGEAHWTAVKNILKDDMKSQTGYVFVLNEGAVVWKRSKHSTTAQQATEAEYIKGARHFKRKYHYVRKSIETGEIDIVKFHTDDNLFDPFTKALAGPKLT